MGAEAFLEGSAELRFPIYRKIGGAVFVDTGSVVEDYEEFGGGKYRQAIGVGVFIETLIGPLRVDVGFNPDRESGEEEVVGFFLIGHPF